MDLKINGEGLSLIKTIEGLKLEAYADTGRVPTLGYGHTKGVSFGDTCTRAQADAWLLEDIAEAEKVVNDNVRYELNDNQFSALVSFAFNIGYGNFKKSTLLKRVNDGDHDNVPYQLTRWVFDNSKMIPGLVRRRDMESALWGKPVKDDGDEEPLVS